MLLPGNSLWIVHHKDMGIASAQNNMGIIEQGAWNDNLSTNPSRRDQREICCVHQLEHPL